MEKRCEIKEVFDLLGLRNRALQEMVDLSVLSSDKAGMRIGKLNIHLFCTLDNLNSFASRDTVGDLGGIDTILCQKHLKFRDVVDDHFAKSRWQHMTGCFCGSITNAWHYTGAFEATTHTVVDTTGSTP